MKTDEIARTGANDTSINEKVKKVGRPKRGAQKGDLLPSGHQSINTQWAYVFKHMFDSGDMKRMGPYTFAVYLAIKTHISYKDEEAIAFPSIRTIADLTGFSTTTVENSLKDLASDAFGLVKIISSGPRKVNKYAITEKFRLLNAHGEVTDLIEVPYVPKQMKKNHVDLENFKKTGELHGNLIMVNITVNNNQTIAGNNNLMITQTEPVGEAIKSVLTSAKVFSNRDLIEAANQGIFEHDIIK